MIGLVLVTHGQLAQAFISALEHVVGPQTHIIPIAVDAEECSDGCRQKIIDAVASVDTGSGAIVLTDMFGGTPSNLALSAMAEGKVEVIAGMNLPMLIKLAKIRDEATISQAVIAAQEAGKKYIHIASSLLSV